MALLVQAGDWRPELRPLMDNQELDGRASAAAIHGETAVTALRDGWRAARAYLELTGYGRPLEF